MYTKVLDNLTGNVSPATSKDCEFLLSYRNTVLHISTESTRSSHNYINNPSSSTTSNMPLPFSNLTYPLHPTYYDRKRDAQEKYTSLIKTPLQNSLLNVNFLDPAITTKAHAALMCETNRKAKYISTKCSIQIEPLYFEWDKFISMLEKHFPDI